MKLFKGHKAHGANRCDYVCVDMDGAVGSRLITIRALDGYYKESAHAAVGVKTAKAIIAEMQRVVDECEAGR